MDRLEGVDVTVIGNLQTDGPFMDKAGPNLKLIARPGIGVDTVDIPAATERNIIVINTPDAPTESTAEHAVALLMAVAKRVMVGDMFLRGAPLDRSLMRGTELYDRVLGVAGYGRIGRRVAEICALGLKMRVRVYDPFVKPGSIEVPAGVELVDSLEKILVDSDFVTLHTPLMPETRQLMNEARFRMMKPGSYLINASRGPVVDEAALIKVLQEGHLAGAGLDVFDPEPPLPDNPLLKMPNVVVTPHIASGTDRGISAMMHGTVDQILQVLRGERPPSMLNPEVWPGRVTPA
jgi:phosphoglycerate dehydrogenase-like enzyme